MSRPQVGSVAVAALLVLASCTTASPPDAGTGDPGLLPGTEDPGTAPSSRAAGDPGASPGGTGGGSIAPSPGVTRSLTTAPRAAYADDGSVGAMARTYLQGQPATRLIVEVDYVSGRAPSSQVLEHLASILRREASKPDGVSVVRGDQIQQTRSSYTFEQIEQLEARHRDRRSAGTTATMYLLYLNGELAEEPGALGVAYRASSAAIFADRIRSAASTLVLPDAIERAVVVHEAGHLLALVNVGYQSRHDHEDPDHPHHSRFRDSVMYWAIEDISVASILTGGPPDDFDRYDRDDLAQLRAS